MSEEKKEKEIKKRFNWLKFFTIATIITGILFTVLCVFNYTTLEGEFLESLGQVKLLIPVIVYGICLTELFYVLLMRNEACAEMTWIPAKFVSICMAMLSIMITVEVAAGLGHLVFVAIPLYPEIVISVVLGIVIVGLWFVVNGKLAKKIIPEGL